MTLPRRRTISAWLSGTRTRGLPPVLLPTDRLLQRWAASQVGGVRGPHLARDPLATLALRPNSGVPPLPDDLAVTVDRIVLEAEEYPRRFVRRWYLRRWESVSALAADLNLPRDAVYGRWNATLWYMRRQLVDASLVPGP